ncbi:MAG: serine/threonine-protein kinase [Polyangiales bacterium]
MRALIDDAWAPGARFDGYALGGLVGEGAMGRVFRATQLETGRAVAIKTLRAEDLEDSGRIARFLREGRAATRIRSPHVVEILEVGRREGAPYLVMELLEGETLEARLREGGPMEVEAACEVLLAVCEGVEAAHRVGVIHRDLKPANVFLTRGVDGALAPKVVDFGISRLMDDQGDVLRTESHALLGTPRYLSPEQTRGSRHASPRSDVYALGAMLYECVTGRPAFPQTNLVALITRIARGELDPPRTLRPTVPEALEAVILRAMAVAPEDRPPTAAALAEALRPFAPPSRALVVTASPPRHPWRVAAAVVVGVMVVLAAVALAAR